MFTQNELKGLLNLLNRVQIQGNEAVVVTLLQQKINGLITTEEAVKKPEAKKEDVNK